MAFLKTMPPIGWIGIGAIAVTLVAGTLLTLYFRKRARELESFIGFFTVTEDETPDEKQEPLETQ